MNARYSPFRPSFGASPPVVAGRSVQVGRFGDALRAGPGAAARTVLFTGARGIGKTVALNEVEDEARSQGWLVLNDTVSPGLLDRLLTELVPQAWRDVAAETTPTPVDPRPRTRVTGVSLPGGVGVEVEREAGGTLEGLRANLSALAEAMAERGAGILLTLDEVHRAGRAGDDLATVAATFQHLVREGRQVAFAGAGLPAAVHDVLTDDVVTFLRRATRFDLGPLTYDDAAQALREPIVRAGRRIGPSALDEAARASRGYPYLVQIIGQHAWEADPSSELVTDDHVAEAVPRAIRDLGTQVHQVAVNDLSDRDRDYLAAMLGDGGVSAVADVLDRMGVTHSYGSRYRQRLILAGMIEPVGRGRVRFALPYLAEYLESLD
ncbi:ATP-binding protein [Nocardioides sp. CFH 31398]|uniref:ATP-binding protein n=1 Tax=Nocardioides sp. CFH 31398 TaxID=2919579 RepID=UPI001F06666A|nr:ATP-binding protein [Nocardioides sp. CFH 31398]MCH1866076.1 ATP-binding protein [Nocardioides sp. CFH 31398]